MLPADTEVASEEPGLKVAGEGSTSKGTQCKANFSPNFRAPLRQPGVELQQAPGACPFKVVTA